MKDKAVLCVDDEVNILNALKRLLRKEDYNVFFANSGNEALSMLERERVQLVITDQRMPEMTGVQLLQKVKENYPDIVRVVLSGYSDANTIVESINKGEVFRFMLKPWDDEELKSVIRQCLEQYDVIRQNHQGG